jgi:hypothetical protein
LQEQQIILRLMWFHYTILMQSHYRLVVSFTGPSWSWSFGSWIYKYLCNMCLSQLKLSVGNILIVRLDVLQVHLPTLSRGHLSTIFESCVGWFIGSDSSTQEIALLYISDDKTENSFWWHFLERKKNVSFDLNKIALDKQFLKAVVITSMLTDFLSWLVIHVLTY